MAGGPIGGLITRGILDAHLLTGGLRSGLVAGTSITDPAQMQAISDYLGLADDTLQTQAAAVGETAVDYLIQARHAIYGDYTEADLDDNIAVVGAVRLAERNIPLILPSALDLTMKGICAGLEDYCLSQQQSKFRLFFKTSMVTSGRMWSDKFRTLWRRSMQEELIVRVGSLSKTSGSWGLWTPDKSLGVDAALEVRAASTIGASPITLNITAATSGGLSETITVSIPAATTQGTTFAVKKTFLRYVQVSTVVALGGSNGDAVEIWVA